MKSVERVHQTKMKLLCVGDIALGDNKLSQQVWDLPIGLQRDCDTRMLINWELPMGIYVNPTPRSGGPRLLSFPGAEHVIRKWSPGFATLATNHILDAGNDGLINTIASLHQMGFITAGAGETCDEIAKP